MLFDTSLQHKFSFAAFPNRLVSKVFPPLMNLFYKSPYFFLHPIHMILVSFRNLRLSVVIFAVRCSMREGKILCARTRIIAVNLSLLTHREIDDRIILSLGRVCGIWRTWFVVHVETSFETLDETFFHFGFIFIKKFFRPSQCCHFLTREPVDTTFHP